MKTRRILQKQTLLVLAALVWAFTGCQQKEDDPAPENSAVNTNAPTEVAFTSATFNATITKLGTGGVTDHGFVWGETTDPDLTATGKQSFGAKTETGNFTHNVTGLMVGTTYHVRAYVTDAQGTFYGQNQTFSTTSDPTITSFSPTEGGQGDEITITGTNFTTSTADITVKFGSITATINSATATEIKVVVPSGVTEGANKITVMVKTQEITSTDDFTYFRGLWTQKMDFEGGARVNAVSFTVGTKGYIAMGRTEFSTSKGLDDLWEYDSTADTWTQKANYKGGKRTLPVAFVLQDVAYVGLGTDETNTDKKDFWQYKPSTNTWTQIADFAGTTSFGRNFAFTVGGKGYVIKEDSNDLWEIDLGVWKQKNALPTSKPISHFVLNDVAYLISEDKKVWKYNTTGDSWTQLQDFPGQDRFVDVSFALNNKGYLAESVLSNTVTFETDVTGLWEYDSTSDAWQKVKSLSDNTENSSITHIFSDIFTIGNLAYVRTGSIAGKTLWEFDPSK